MVSTGLGESRAWQEQTDEGQSLLHQVSLHEAKQDAVITLEHIHNETIEGTNNQEITQIAQRKVNAIRAAINLRDAEQTDLEKEVTAAEQLIKDYDATVEGLVNHKAFKRSRSDRKQKPTETFEEEKAKMFKFCLALRYFEKTAKEKGLRTEPVVDTPEENTGDPWTAPRTYQHLTTEVAIQEKARPQPRAHIQAVTPKLANANLNITVITWGSRFMRLRQCPPHDIRLDVRHFNDQFRALGSRRSGNHPVVIRGIARHPNFREWLAHVKRQTSLNIFEIMEKGEMDIIIACNCLSGKHRSVACAAIIKYCLSYEGFTNIKTIHQTLEIETPECPCDNC